MKQFAKLMSATAVAATMLTACGGQQINKNVQLKNDLDSLSYAYGSLMGYQYHNSKEQAEEQLEIKFNYEAFLAGFQTGAEFDTINLKFKSPQEAQEVLQSITGVYEQKKMTKIIEESRVFLEENSKKEGVVALENGLQYQILEEGTGDKPEVYDTVVCDYVGTLVDGTEFDSSIKRGEPATFPLNQVIRGWQELISMMPKGSKWKLFIPAEYGYGVRGTNGIPPNSALIFEVKLIDFMKGVKPAEK